MATMCFSFWTFGQQYCEKWNMEKFKSLLGINLVKYSSEILTHLGHAGTSTSVQNNCIKLSGFGVDITRLFLHREIIARNILCREKFFYPKIRSQIFRTNPICFFHYLPFYFRLNKTGNEVFPEWAEIYR